MQIRFFLFIICSVLLTGILPACRSKKTTPPDYTAELTALNAAYDSALMRGDTALLNRLYAPDFVLTNPDGRLLNRQEQLINVATSELRWDNARSENVSVKIYGNTALLFGEFYGSGTYRGNPLSVHERYTTVWIKTDTSWQLLAEQANIIRP